MDSSLALFNWPFFSTLGTNSFESLQFVSNLTHMCGDYFLHTKGFVWTFPGNASAANIQGLCLAITICSAFNQQASFFKGCGLFSQTIPSLT